MVEAIHVCAVCGRVLDYREGLGWSHTMMDLVSEDHPAVPVPEGQVPTRPRCDFCSSDDVTHALVARPLRTVLLDDDGEVQQDSRQDAGWACCTLCAEDILADRWNDVTRRAMKSVTGVATEFRAAVYQHMQQLHQQVRNNMVTPPTKLPLPG